MLDIVASNLFKKDIKLAKKRGFDISLLREVVTTLAQKKQLDEKYRDHALQGKYKGFRECHVEPDWLLVYQIRKTEIELYLFRT